MPEMLEVTLSQKDIDRVLKRLDKFKGRPLAFRADKAIRAGASLMVKPMRAQAARHNRTEATSKSITVRALKKRVGEITAYTVGPRTPQAHLVIRSHRIMPEGTDTGRRTRPDPYVDRVITALEPRVRAFVDDRIASL